MTDMNKTDTPNMNTNGDRTPAADLALIRGMMEAGRKRAGIDGTHLVIWGAILMTAFFAQYAAVVGRLKVSYIVIWSTALALGWVLSFLLGRRMRADRPCGPNPALVAYSSVWMSVGLGVMVYWITAVVSQSFDARSITLLSTGLFGTAFFVIGRVMAVRWLTMVAAGWWLLMAYIAAMKSYDAELLLVMAAACGLLLLLPGQLMKRLARHEA